LINIGYSEFYLWVLSIPVAGRTKVSPAAEYIFNDNGLAEPVKYCLRRIVRIPCCWLFLLFFLFFRS